MARLTLITSNRLERLVEGLARILAQPLTEPLAPDVVVVQSKGMERWVRMALARINGVCANTLFPFPRAFLRDVFGRCFPDRAPSPQFDPEVMTFRILARLGRRIREPGFEALSAYLQGDADPLKAYGISRKIAHLFDQYLVFRPEMILSWESGKEKDWQADLWRDLIGHGPPFHPARMFKGLVEALRARKVRIQDHFQRICIFGISYLPPVYLQVFAEMGRQVPVYFFLMNPCQEYWSDIVSDFEARRLRKDYPEARDAVQALHLERGNRLLAAWGVQGKQFFSAIHALEARVEEDFQTPEGNTVLSRIQKDILTLSEPEPIASFGSETQKGLRPDRSLCIHACHSPLREMEVLHDFLLDLFESEPGLAPHDILVMAPAMETYAPAIQAVFGGGSGGRPKIPFHLADPRIGMEETVVAAFLALLLLHDTRLGAAQVLDLLEHPPVRRRFLLSEGEVQRIGQWVKETRIRWGIDAADRMRWGLPGSEENTWEAGLQRLLMGYAIRKKEEKDVAGILPHDAVEGEWATALGRFFDFFDKVTYYHQAFESPRDMGTWVRLFNKLLDETLFADASEMQGLFAVRDALNRLETVASHAGFEEALPFPVVRAFLKEHLGREREGARFASGGVTFCTLLPMRSIPARVICLVGMNDGAFPREDFSLTFDRMALHPRAGDRSRRRDDKYLFLEALLSARQYLHISYVGMNMKDNASMPPSVLVTQLVDYVRDGYGIAEANLVVRHRLHPFSRDYFRDHPVLFSYSQDDFSAAKGSLTRFVVPPPFMEGPLAPPDRTFESLDLEDLCRFFWNPPAFFMKNRLGIHLPEEDLPLEEREPFRLDALEAFHLVQALVEACLKGMPPEKLYTLWRLEGRLPHGNVGRVLFHRIHQEITPFVRQIRNACGGAAEAEVSGEFRQNGIFLSGKVTGIYGNFLVRYRYVKAPGKDLLDTWIRYLFFSSLFPERAQGAVTLSKDKMFRFRAVSNAASLLESLLALYREGLSKPLSLFPQASFEYARQRFYNGTSNAEALNRARKKWIGTEIFPGDAGDPYIERCFRGIAPLEGRFEAHAERVFSPLFEHLEKGNAPT